LRNWANQGIDWADYPHLKRWFDLIAARPAVQRGTQVMADLRPAVRTAAEHEVLFGKAQQIRR
jgi:GST-like protein